MQVPEMWHFTRELIAVRHALKEITHANASGQLVSLAQAALSKVDARLADALAKGFTA
ncbi:MAG TPA: hypothetical protein VK454_08825 [Myxococcaceae bacterium]|nr:hypothetical protein [Myxococcaceae bacterium]